MLESSRSLKWGLAAILLLLTIVAVITSYLIVERQQALQRVSRYNLTWLLSQAATETVRVAEVVAAAAVPGSTIEHDDIAMRFDILENRLSLLQNGEAAEFIQARPDELATIADLGASLAAARSLAGPPLTAEAALRIRARLDAMVPRMLHLAAAANARSGELVAEDQRQLSRLHWTLAGLLFAIMACAAALTWLLGWVRSRLVRQLVTAKEAAETANAAKSQFLANMSHELRTPLNGMLGMLQILQLGPLPPKQQQYAETALRSGKILLDLIAGVLDFARIEAKQVELRQQPFDLADLLRDVEDLLGAQAQAQKLTLTMQIAPAVPRHLIGDVDRLRQVLLNVVGNAVKFTQVGNVSVMVTPGILPPGILLPGKPAAAGIPLQFTVRDTGIGIRADKLASIFEPFGQADASKTRRFGGVGLGLTIAREIVESMGGTIGVTSREAVGSDFTFSVLLQRDPAADAAPANDQPISLSSNAVEPEEPDPITPRPATRHAMPRALLVEDEPVNSMVAKHFLQVVGYGVDEVEDGLRALARLDRETYDLILIDYHLPGIDGVEVTRQIRAREAGQAHRNLIIGLSANASEAERALCLAAGMDDFLTKPVTYHQIQSTIHRWAGTAAPQAVKPAAK
jgi:signal transduction histidine kinase/CheY-like chemotaxis protein